MEGSQFNDIGLMCDGAAAGMGVARVRLKLGAPWLENCSLVRLYQRNVPSPHGPLPVLAHRRHGPLGSGRICRLAYQIRGLEAPGVNFMPLCKFLQATAR